MTCKCTKGLSSNHILLECPITTQSFRNDGYHVTACNDVRGMMYIIDVLTLIAKLLVYRTALEKCILTYTSTHKEQLKTQALSTQSVCV